MPVYERCPRCGMTGLRNTGEYPEVAACIMCGFKAYRGGVRNDQPTVGPDGFQWAKLERRAKRDLAIFWGTA